MCRESPGTDHAEFAHTVSCRFHHLHDQCRHLCIDFEKELILQPCQAAKDELQAEIAVRGFWQSMQRAFVDAQN